MADLEALALEVIRCRDRLHSIEATLTAHTLLQTHTAKLMSTLQEEVERLARADEIAAAVRVRLLSWPIRLGGALVGASAVAASIRVLVG